MLTNDSSIIGFATSKDRRDSIPIPQEVKEKKKVIVYDENGRVSARKRNFDPCRELNLSRREMWELGKTVTKKVDNIDEDEDPAAQKKTRITLIMEKIDTQIDEMRNKVWVDAEREKEARLAYEEAVRAKRRAERAALQTV